MAESSEELLKAIELFQAQARVVTNRRSRAVRIDMLIRVEDMVRRTLAFRHFRHRFLVLSDLFFIPEKGFCWECDPMRPAKPQEILDKLPFEEVVQGLTEFIRYLDPKKKGKRK